MGIILIKGKAGSKVLTNSTPHGRLNYQQKVRLKADRKRQKMTTVTFTTESY
jgi:hypothetical protein